MARKNHAHTVLSNVPCTSCGSLLKQNLLDKKPNAMMCYDCYQNMNPQENANRGWRDNPNSKAFKKMHGLPY